MMNTTTILIIVTWLAGAGPHITTQAFADAAACRAALTATTRMLQAQAKTNLTGSHLPLVVDTANTADGVALSTPIGREVARLACVASTPPAQAESAASRPAPR